MVVLAFLRRSSKPAGTYSTVLKSEVILISLHFASKESDFLVMLESALEQHFSRLSGGIPTFVFGHWSSAGGRSHLDIRRMHSNEQEEL